MREGVQMRKVLALLLSVVMVMSLLVVAGAQMDTSVTLSIEPRKVAPGDTEVLFDIYLNPNGTKEIGAFQFSVSGQGCTITDAIDKNNLLVFDEETNQGAFAYFGGALNNGVYTFVAAGTAKRDGGSHFWNATTKTKIVTLTATITPEASECKLIVDQESDKRFSVGYDDDSGSGVQPCYEVTVDSKAETIPSGDIPVESVTVVPSNAAMAPGSTMMPTAIVSPANHTETGSAVWSKVSGSDNITIDPTTGMVTVSSSAMADETATIRATFGDKCGECVITVSALKYTVSGTATSYGSTTDPVTIQLIQSGTSEAAYETVVYGNTASYSIAGVAPSTYTLRVMKKNHVTREYTVTVGVENVTQDVKIHLKGDINGDGAITTKDRTFINRHLEGTTLLTDYRFLCGDIDGNGEITTKDRTFMNRHLEGSKPLW